MVAYDCQFYRIDHQQRKQSMGCANGSTIAINSQKKNENFKSAVLFTQALHEQFTKNILSIVNRMHRNKAYTLQLTFRASMNNFEAEKFHESTHGIEGTILLAKSKENRIFGGYTSCAWQKDLMYEYKTDEKMTSFLFTIIEPVEEDKSQLDITRQDKDKDDQEVQPKKKQKSKKNKKQKQKALNEYKIFKVNKKQHAIMNHSTCGPVFGQGHDLYIANQCHKNDNWANLGKSYQCQHPFGSRKANSQLGGSAKFFIIQYQIWRLVF